MTRVPALRGRDVLQGQDKLGVLVGGQDRDQVVGLKDEAHPVPAEAGQRAPAQFRQVAPFQVHRALAGRVQGADHVEDGGLARTGGAAQGAELPGPDIQVQPVHRPDLDIALPVYPAHPGKPDNQFLAHLKSP